MSLPTVDEIATNLQEQLDATQPGWTVWQNGPRLMVGRSTEPIVRAVTFTRTEAMAVVTWLKLERKAS